ncbi:Glycine zipper [bacterium A37T11]|nr:Glycine zipper [bacterium A37T11]
MKKALRLLITSGISVSLFACHSSHEQSSADALASDTSTTTGINNTNNTVGVSEKNNKIVVTQTDTAGLAAFKVAQKRHYDDSLKALGAKEARTTVAPPKKSHAARNGAIIGAGAGALTGALVTKHKRGVGALIGGVAGGAAGYGVGKIVEKKKAKN